MLTFSVHSLEDETYFSFLVRLYRRSGCRSWRAFQMRFADKEFNAHVLPPWGIGQLLPLFPENSVGELFEKYTTFPYFRPFLGQKLLTRINDFVEQIGDVGGAKPVLVNAHQAKPAWAEKELRFCPTCVSEQSKIFSSSGWLRSHQLPGVSMCWQHEVPLLAIPTSRTIDILPHEVSGNVYELKKRKGDALWLAKASFSLLDMAMPSIPGTVRNQVYRNGIYKLGCGTPSYTDHKLLNSAIYDVWHRETLRQLDISLPNERSESWIRMLLTDHAKTSHPLLNLVLIRALFNDVATFVNEVRKIENITSPLAPSHVNHSYVFEADNNQRRLQKRAELTAFLLNEETPSIEAFKRLSPLAHKWLIRNDSDWIKAQFRNGNPTQRFSFELRLKRRKGLLAYLASNPWPTKSGFEHLDLSAYRWLCKHDKLWMDEQFNYGGVKQRASTDPRVSKRKTLLLYLSETTSPAKTDFQRSHKTAYEWLRINDKIWMDEQFCYGDTKLRPSVDLRPIRRNALLQYLASTPWSNKAGFCRVNRSAYSWLLRNDRVWMAAQFGYDKGKKRPKKGALADGPKKKVTKKRRSQ